MNAIAPPHQSSLRQAGHASFDQLSGPVHGKNRMTPQSQRDGGLIYDYYFGTRESIEAIKDASKYMMPGFPRFVSLSGNALATWPLDRILAFLKAGLDYFIIERKEYPCIFLASIQAENNAKAFDVAQKLKAIDQFRSSYAKGISL